VRSSLSAARKTPRLLINQHARTIGIFYLGAGIFGMKPLNSLFRLLMNTIGEETLERLPVMELQMCRCRGEVADTECTLLAATMKS